MDRVRRPNPTSGAVLAVIVAAVTLSVQVPATAQPRSEYRVERPPAGSWQRGAIPAPRWLVLGLGAATATGALALLLRRAQKRRNS